MLENAKSWLGTTPIKRSLCGFVLAAVFGLSTGPAFSQEIADPNARAVTSAAAPLGEAEQRILLDEIEDYFSQVETLQARFVQYNMDGSLFRGQVYIDRPGMMRIDYDAPIPYKIIADGNFYIIVDEELEEASHIPLPLTPAHMMLREPMNLGEDLLVKDAARSDGALFITLAQQNSPNAGTLTLAFTEEPLALRQWTVIDGQGIITRVLLEDPVLGLPLNPELFKFNNPWDNREGGN